MTADELKAFCKERNLTYKELAEIIGMTEGSLKVAITTNKISTQTEASIKLLKENQKLEARLSRAEQIKQIFKEWVQEP